MPTVVDTPITSGIGYDLIDRGTLAASTTYTSPTWTAGKYREIRIFGAASTTGNVKITFPGIAAGYSTVYYAAVADAGQWLLAPGADKQTWDSHIYPLTTGMERCGVSQWFAANAGTPLTTNFTYSGYCTDTTTAITQFVITCATPATGTITVYGLPA